MINPNGSNVPQARKLLQEILSGNLGYVDPDVHEQIQEALDLMRRQRPVRVANTQQRIRITPAIKAAVLALAGDLTLSNADIAKRVGLPHCASGRVTEILQGLR